MKPFELIREPHAELTAVGEQILHPLLHETHIFDYENPWKSVYRNAGVIPILGPFARR